MSETIDIIDTKSMGACGETTRRDEMGAQTQETPMPTIPLSFKEIADDLDERIKRGEYDNDENRLPTYVEVADIYDVSRSTAARAYALLVDRGRVKGSAGRGMFVAD